MYRLCSFINVSVPFVAVLTVFATVRIALAVPPACYTSFCTKLTGTACYECCNKRCSSADKTKCQDCCDTGGVC